MSTFANEKKSANKQFRSASKKLLTILPVLLLAISLLGCVKLTLATSASGLPEAPTRPTMVADVTKVNNVAFDIAPSGTLICHDQFDYGQLINYIEELERGYNP